MKFVWLMLAAFAEPQGLRVPAGLDAYIPVPETNPITKESVQLGRKLFFDKRLSRDSSVSCATCHDPQYAFTDARKLAVGVDGRTGDKRVPRILNRAYGKAFFWDGRVIPTGRASCDADSESEGDGPRRRGRRRPASAWIS